MLELLLEDRQLVIPANQRGVEAALPTRSSGDHLEDVPRRYRLGFPLDFSFAEWLGLHRVADHPKGGFADEDLAGSGRLLESRGHVDRIPGGERLSGIGCSGEDLPRIQPGSGLDLNAPVPLELLVQRLQLASHLKRRSHRSQRVVLMEAGDAEHRHDRVSDELLRYTTMTPDHAGHFREVAAHNLLD